MEELNKPKMMQLRELFSGKKTPEAKEVQNIETAQETLADDYADVPAALMQKIQQTEPLVRQVLALVQVDYDALIKMDGKSPYAQAIKANKHVLNEVAKADNPVLRALEISLKYKPIAEFKEKYGNTPDDIKQKMKQELMEEMARKEVPTQNLAQMEFNKKSAENVKSTEQDVQELNKFFK